MTDGPEPRRHPDPSPAEPSAESDPGPEFRAIGPADRLPAPGHMASFWLDGVDVLVANVRGRYHAIDGLCEHAGAPLVAGRLIGPQVTCALHAWTYDVTDGWITNPPLGRRTQSYRVRIRAGQVEVAADPRE